MDIRVLQYFLAVTREESILGAANALHISQPSLSRQMRELEEELGKTLFLRGNRHITLTEDGILLRKRAEEIIALMQKTTDELMQSDADISGDIYIGGGESDNIRYLLDSAKAVRDNYPQIRFHIVSGDRKTVLEDLDEGLIDFGFIFGNVDTSKYESVSLNCHEQMGVLMRKDDSLANREELTSEDLRMKALITSRQMYETGEIAKILQLKEDEYTIAGTYNLLYNGSIMVEKGMGYAICFGKIINTSGDSPLIFIPLKTDSQPAPLVVWKKYQIFSKTAQKFKDELEKIWGIS